MPAIALTFGTSCGERRSTTVEHGSGFCDGCQNLFDAFVKPLALSRVDLLLDVAGGDGINQSIAATKVGGRIAQIGFLTGQTSALNLMPMIFRQTTIRGIAVAPRSSFDRMNEFLNEHKIRPVIDHVYPFDQAREAYEHLARGAFGKVVIKIA